MTPILIALLKIRIPKIIALGKDAPPTIGPEEHVVISVFNLIRGFIFNNSMN